MGAHFPKKRAGYEAIGCLPIFNGSVGRIFSKIPKLAKYVRNHCGGFLPQQERQG